MGTFSYHIEGRFEGYGEYNSIHAIPHSLAYLCTTCGNLWARVICDDPRTVILAVHAPCRGCRRRGAMDWGYIPGSLLCNNQLWQKDLPSMWWGRSLECLPEALLRRELDLTLQYFENLEKENGES